jgi:hypothetical protein
MVTVAASAKAPARPGANGAAGVTVKLEDLDGDVLATTETAGDGSYSFNEQSGPSGDPGIAPGLSATGVYQVVLVPPTGMKQTGANPGAVKITRGDSNVIGVNFTLTPLTVQPPPKPVKKR